MEKELKIIADYLDSLSEEQLKSEIERLSNDPEFLKFAGILCFYFILKESAKKIKLMEKLIDNQQSMIDLLNKK